MLCAYHKFVFEKPRVMADTKTSFIAHEQAPVWDKKTDSVHPLASVIGHVHLGKDVYVAPFASIRGDEGVPIHIGDFSNVQDGVVVHALETELNGKEIPQDLYEYNGKKYAVYIGNKVSLAHQSQVHGPAIVDDDVFVGMKSFVFKAKVGKKCVLEPGAMVIGVEIPSGRYVPAGSVIKDQKSADKLPKIDDLYKFKSLNDAVVHVNEELAESYHKKYGF